MTPVSVTVEDYQMTNEHAYMEVSLSSKSHGVIPLELYQHNIIGRDKHKDRRNPWYTVRYEVGKWSKFKIDIAFFRGVNESKKSYFAIDDIQVKIIWRSTTREMYEPSEYLHKTETNFCRFKYF